MLCDYNSLCLSVGHLVGQSYVHFFGILRVVFASPLLPNHILLMLSCIRHPPLPPPSGLLLLPNPRDLCCRVYGLFCFLVKNWTLHAGKPARKKSISNFFVNSLLLTLVVVVTYFAIFHLIINLVSLITFERTKPKWWDWAHLKDPFKSFQNVTKYM